MYVLPQFFFLKKQVDRVKHGKGLRDREQRTSASGWQLPGNAEGQRSLLEIPLRPPLSWADAPDKYPHMLGVLPQSDGREGKEDGRSQLQCGLRIYISTKTELGSAADLTRPSSAIYWLCGLGQITQPLWASPEEPSRDNNRTNLMGLL